MLTLLFRLLKFSPRLTVKLAAYLFATPNRIPRPPHENELIQHGQRMVFRCGLVAYKFGEGQPVLLVHGWEGRGTQLGSFAEALKNKYAVYAVDWPAHGESPGKNTTPTHYATFIKSVARELGPLKAIISHSFGAGCSVLAAYDGLEVEKMVLIAGPDRYARVVNFYCDRLGMDEKTKELFFKEVTIRVGMTPEDLEVSKLAKKIKPQLLIVHDRNDKAVSFDSAERIHAAIPSSKLLATEGLGHRRVLKDANVIKTVTDFIN